MPLDAPVNGGVEFDFYSPWDDPCRDNCAIYVREGAIIPKRELEQYIGQLYSQGKMNPVTFSIYPGRDSKYVMYLDDDGVTNSAEKEGKYRLTQISHQGKRVWTVPAMQDIMEVFGINHRKYFSGLKQNVDLKFALSSFLNFCLFSSKNWQTVAE